jgi:hypothetical protein
LYGWGSNAQSQLGKKLPSGQIHSNTPVHLTAFETAKPFKIACGSYHNICLSYRTPKQEENESEVNDENAKVGKVSEK